MFENLEPEKQKRILNAAYEELAKEGYEKASTNKIVKKAGIGKGMLFYYFKSKKDLFNYLVDYGTKTVINDYLSLLDNSERDYIERIKKASMVKLGAMKEHPHIFNFFGALYVNRGVEWDENLESKMLEVRNLTHIKLFSNIDTSLFREDVSPDKIFKLINWTMEGIEKDIVNSLKGQNLVDVDYDPYWKEFFDYLDDLKKILYK
ncbi:TetR/AcrR family transcriptional regulator [Alkaliphilus serpentinus]|uniref:TetR/AcrR family transcriptional regulator n=1 Tax=Alkaliphilus serpentinus TaxID=1482731 RepID=A0A833HNA5_9FIRM|nr:TetR/AcrR family transcriptional regulator [Alkaliphilus serpentinus]KAB3529324.1 TetR/AcrR family transcriptional regulator [Alkaliphilus serpentinus]